MPGVRHGATLRAASWLVLVSLAALTLARGASAQHPVKRPQSRLDAPLIAAVRSENATRIRQLLAAHADPNCSDLQHRRVLDIALVRLEDLREPAGAWPPTFKSAMARAIAPVSLLVSAGATLNDTADPALPVAAMYGGYPQVIELLIAHGAHVNGLPSSGPTALAMAAIGGHSGAVKVLLQHGALVNVVFSYPAFETALMAAVARGRSDIVSLLLGHKANPNLGGRADMPALEIAAGNPLTGPAIVTLLLRAHASANGAGRFGITPLMNAAMNGSPETVQLLLAAGANARLADTEGHSTLFYAKGHPRRTALIEAALRRK